MRAGMNFTLPFGPKAFRIRSGVRNLRSSADIVFKIGTTIRVNSEYKAYY